MIQPNFSDIWPAGLSICLFDCPALMALAPDLAPSASEVSLRALQGISASPPHLHQYASAAWRFLDAAGYINFGLAADITAQRERKRTQPLRGSVIVVGAGLSGQPSCWCKPQGQAHDMNQVQHQGRLQTFCRHCAQALLYDL